MEKSITEEQWIISSPQKRRKERERMRADRIFDEIMLREIKLKITEAFLSIEISMRIDEFQTSQLNVKDVEYIEKKANQMKEEINSFIDSQVKRLQVGEGA